MNQIEKVPERKNIFQIFEDLHPTANSIRTELHRQSNDWEFATIVSHPEYSSLLKSFGVDHSGTEISGISIVSKDHSLGGGHTDVEHIAFVHGGEYNGQLVYLQEIQLRSREPKLRVNVVPLRYMRSGVFTPGYMFYTMNQSELHDKFVQTKSFVMESISKQGLSPIDKFAKTG